MCKPRWTLKGMLQGATAIVIAVAILLFVVVFGAFIFIGMAIRSAFDMAVLNWALRKGRV